MRVEIDGVKYVPEIEAPKAVDYDKITGILLDAIYLYGTKDMVRGMRGAIWNALEEAQPGIKEMSGEEQEALRLRINPDEE